MTLTRCSSAARPAGPTCHTDARSCFDVEPAPGAEADRTAAQDFAWLERLWSTIDERARTRPQGSYTTSLLEAGVDATARKVSRGGDRGGHGRQGR